MSHRDGNFENIGPALQESFRSQQFRPIGDFFVPSALTNKTEYIGPFPLGIGGYGTVVGYEHKSAERKKDVAVKRFDKPFDNPKKAQRCFREIQLLRDLKHENIVKLKFAYTTDCSRHQLYSVYLMTEFAGLDLSKQLHDETEENHKFTLRSFQSMICELLRALKYLNSANVIHRDLKPDNLAINANGKLTLLDFGIARAKDDGDVNTQGPGSAYYRAIETISFGGSEVKAYNEKADMWSIGAILCEMLTDRILFMPTPSEDHFHKSALLKAISICGPIPEIVIREDIDHEDSKRRLRIKSANAVRIDFLEHFRQTGLPWLREDIITNGPALIDFIDSTLSFDHRTRMSFEEALSHSFLADVRLPEKEVTASQTIQDYGDRHVEWKQMIWELIQQFPILLD